MSDLSILQWAARIGALYCAGAYVYAFILKSRGDRRWQTFGLLCSGFALAAFGAVVPATNQTQGLMPSVITLLFLSLSVAAQSVAAFRGRRGDRRVERHVIEERLRTAPQAPASAAASPN